MKVILLENIKNIGQMGDIKNVADGYGRNFLLPNKLARLATADGLRQASVLKQKLAGMQEIERKNAESVAAQLEDKSIEIVRRASKTGTLYDGIEKKDIAEAIKSAFQIEISENMIQLTNHIKKTGDYVIEIEILPEVKSSMKLSVKPLAKALEE
ncbi:MAG: 50S ribosomal protein L9 [Candidatus Yanofskybacteria bacterium GW2011_GWA1_44_21]|uniref:Large ribosomal subunit protein bL9 n=2 Tax=Candidatus Yanofskyibacteriota TaxID=1752733 RepID=A0A1F8H1S2_9BACT|nr:MAG: 50S ribosomal protein L9 [Candidatus Yanofskybacteria bacterium GW2011_GWA2_44_10]KKT50512.1 MAG: 50S ribosomal protein L9 [Candidatus Yanofskybacteria bacterium GW2011_GWA1_44_21]KKT90296.1 MAG: 50S ribosomal protein L9 [Candidatus Yanofskybacteria bacterium GW2011_GWB1_45_11]OGN03050.1 MAG: 50S ribosomal protein L9 [Candidatus Yanofskybacteria bacterium RIFCSPHIGHO2_01_FULL_44_110b]OGN14548.1 MAG: 50S ribosomal protein L9 [Candidatus Yanofskybacteria bacterium RIFCSPHIGHO2_02_FULL_44_